MIKVALGEIADIVSGGTPKSDVSDYWGGNVQWVTPADLSGLTDAYISFTPRTLTESGLRSCSATVLPPGSVLLSSRAPIGHVAITRAPMATNQGFKSLVPRHDRVDAKYLYHWLRANKTLLQNAGNGATFKEISKAVVARIELPLPPLDQQRRLAAILDQADTVRTKRREVLDALTALDLAVFESMFPDYSEGNTNTVRLEDVLFGIDGGSSPVCESRPARSNEWGVLKLGAVTYGTFRPNENKAYLGSVAGMERNEVQTGDVLMTRKNTRDLVGAVAIVDQTHPHLLMPDLVFRLRLNTEKVAPKYFQALMMAPKMRRVVRNLSSGSAASMPNISKARLSQMRIHLPPLSQQVAFTERRRYLDVERRLAERQLVVADELLASLQSRAFRGEL